jgi:prepilin-type N-terminal cleavage/methylation domain-containing protein
MNSSKASINRGGYTLIEIMVSLTIIGIVFGVGYVAFRDFSRRQLLAGVARMVSSDLHLAQAQALAGKKPDDSKCNSPETLESYNFRVDSTDSYTISAQCTGGEVLIKTVNLPPEAAIIDPKPFLIQYKILGQGTNIITGRTQNITIFAYNSGRRVTVTASGSVQ